MNMSTSNSLEDLSPDLLASLRAYLGKPQVPLAASCDHGNIPCAWKSRSDHSCKIQSLRDAWNARDRSYPMETHPLVVALAGAGCDPLRARMVLNNDGYGMEVATSSSVIEAFRRLRNSSSRIVPMDIGVCDQCQPGTNTFTLQGVSYRGSCWPVPVSVAENTPLTETRKVLCIGTGGELRWCGEGEFMAVSHVWEHGWKGDSEKGLCSRVLNMLLLVAGFFGLEWVWLDVAMISKDPKIKAMSINSMNLVYSAAKVTVVCDRLLLSMGGGENRERTMLVFLTDWMTRVWTMQEAILSEDLTFIFGDCYMSGKELLRSIIDETPGPEIRWQRYRAIDNLYGMLGGATNPMLDRVYMLSRERRTSKRTDLVRAIYPLFEIKWPGPSTTLEEGQIKLLQHLGEKAGRTASLHGPIMPKPWSWAPLTIAGSDGTLQIYGMYVTPDGLHGQWAAWDIQVVGKEEPNSPLVRPDGYGSTLARLTDTCYDMIHFKVGTQSFHGQVYYRRENPYPWPGQKLLLLRGNNTGSPRTSDLDYYHLVVVDPRTHSSGLTVMHRVGSVAGGVDGEAHAQGLLVKDPPVTGYIS